jgi:hypothetical protein
MSKGLFGRPKASQKRWSVTWCLLPTNLPVSFILLTRLNNLFFMRILNSPNATCCGILLSFMRLSVVLSTPCNDNTRNFICTLKNTILFNISFTRIHSIQSWSLTLAVDTKDKTRMADFVYVLLESDKGSVARRS